ncbi:unnamed protein product [Camellia sinensis]
MDSLQSHPNKKTKQKNWKNTSYPEAPDLVCGKWRQNRSKADLVEGTASNEEEDQGRSGTGGRRSNPAKLPPWGKRRLTKRERLGIDNSQGLLSKKEGKKEGGREERGGRRPEPPPPPNGAAGLKP